ncbi:MAG TPA: hypothetical protein DEP35_11135, partial [Deltaproteobacteria bacterium]|nr:hypothetical protein [Deltaproteobacteria bacterium]
RRAVPAAKDEALAFSIAPRVRFCLTTLLLVAWLLALPSAVPLLRHGLSPRALEDFAARALVVGCSASAAALLVFGVLWHLAQGDRCPPETASRAPES